MEGTATGGWKMLGGAAEDRGYVVGMEVWTGRH